MSRRSRKKKTLLDEILERFIHLAPNKSVYPSHIRDLNTVKHYNQVNIAYLVSTGKFSEESYKLAKQLGVRLIDGKALQRMRSELVRQ